MQDSMLTIHSINPTGMFSYGRSKDINVKNKGIVHLTGINEDKSGDSNGSGKSSLFNAACELLFRENPTGCKGDELINAMWSKGMAGRIYFTNYLGDHYRVTYCRKWKDSLYPADNDTNTAYLGTALYLDKYEDHIWVDTRGASMAETQTRILEVIGMTYSRFLAIAYMSPRLGDLFLKGTNKDRMDILSGITGIEEWDDILDRSRVQRKALKGQIQAITDKVNFERGSLQTLQEQYQAAKAFNWSEYVSSHQDSLNASRESWKQVDEAIKSHRARITNLVATQNEAYNEEKVESTREEIQLNNDRIKQLDKRMWSTPSVDRKELVYPERVRSSGSLELAAKLATYQSKVSDKEREIASSKGHLQAFLSESGSLMDVDKCPTCDSSITSTKKETLNSKVSALELKCKDLESQLHFLNKEVDAAGLELTLHNEQGAAEHHKLVDQYKIDKATRAEEDAELLKEHRQKIEKQKAEIQAKINKLTKDIQVEREVYAQYATKIQAIENTMNDLKISQAGFKAEGLEHKSKIEQANKSIDQLKASAGQIEEQSKHLEFLKGEINTVQTDLDVYLWLIDNIPYIKLHKMSVAMSEISDLANEYLEDLGDSLRLSITSFEQKARQKNAEDVKALMKSDVKIEIIDGSKNISPKLYSDGEASKISVAIIRALHELARKYGQGCNLMLLDEVFSFVDSSNQQKLASSISKLLKKGTVFVTDNSGAVTDLMDFDHTWVARKVGGKTELQV